jgi:hypothetical protein
MEPILRIGGLKNNKFLVSILFLSCNLSAWAEIKSKLLGASYGGIFIIIYPYFVAYFNHYKVQGTSRKVYPTIDSTHY